MTFSVARTDFFDLALLPAELRLIDDGWSLYSLGHHHRDTLPILISYKTFHKDASECLVFACGAWVSQNERVGVSRHDSEQDFSLLPVSPKCRHSELEVVLLSDDFVADVLPCRPDHYLVPHDLFCGS